MPSSPKKIGASFYVTLDAELVEGVRDRLVNLGFINDSSERPNIQQWKKQFARALFNPIYRGVISDEFLKVLWTEATNADRGLPTMTDDELKEALAQAMK